MTLVVVQDISVVLKIKVMLLGLDVNVIKIIRDTPDYFNYRFEC